MLQKTLVMFLGIFAVIQCSGFPITYERDFVEGDKKRALRQLDFLERFWATTTKDEREWNYKSQNLLRDETFGMEVAQRKQFETLTDEIEELFIETRTRRRPPIVALIDALKRGLVDFAAVICLSWHSDWHVDMSFYYPPRFHSYSQIAGFGSLCLYLAEALIEKIPFLALLALLVFVVRFFLRRRLKRQMKAASLVENEQS